MARSRFSALLATYFLSGAMPSALALSSAMQAAELVGLLPRASSGCANSSFTACNQDGLPGNFCCPSGQSCFVFNSAQSVICCPPGKDCSSISTISCDLSLQNATTNPTSPLFTTQLQSQMSACGKGCCPSGMSCSNEGQTCVANPSPSGSSSSSSTVAAPSSSVSSTPADRSASSSATSSLTSSTATANSTSASSTTGDSGPSALQCNQFPVTAILVGLFSGLVAGIILTVLLICCFGRAGSGSRKSQHSDFSDLTANISDPIYQDGNSRADFLRRESKSRDRVSRTERVKSFFRTPTMRSQKSQVAILEVSGTTMTRRGTERSSTAAPKTPSTLRHQASGESITIYSPPNLHGPPDMPMPRMTERNTTVGSIVDKVDGRSNKDSPPNTDFEKMLAEVGWKTNQPFLGSPGMVDPRSRRIGDV